jgi:hypothetical protein
MEKKKDFSPGRINSEPPNKLEPVQQNTNFNELYLNSLIDKAKDTWTKIGNADEWVRELRGGIEESKK